MDSSLAHIAICLVLIPYAGAAAVYLYSLVVEREIRFAGGSLNLGLFFHCLLIFLFFFLSSSKNELLSLPALFLFASFFAVALFSFYKKQAKGSFLGALVSIISILYLLIASFASHADTSAQRDSVASVELICHVIFIAGGFSFFAFSFALSVAQIIKEVYLEKKSDKALCPGIPALYKLEELNLLFVVIGEILLVSGLIAGALYMSKIGLAFSLTEVRIVFVFLSAVLYLAVIFLKYVFSMRGKALSWLSLAGFLFLICSALASNLLESGAHV